MVVICIFVGSNELLWNNLNFGLRQAINDNQAYWIMISFLFYFWSVTGDKIVT